jgi:hypothetical protein
MDEQTNNQTVLPDSRNGVSNRPPFNPLPRPRIPSGCKTDSSHAAIGFESALKELLVCSKAREKAVAA